MKLTTLLITAAGCTLLAAASCKKSNNNDQVRNELIGTWGPVNDAKDLNGNGQLDNDELIAAVRYNTHTLIYGSDGVLKVMSQSNQVSGELNWSLEYNNTYLKTTDIGSNATQSIQHIDKITTSELTLKDTTGGVIQWFLFKKQ